MSKLAKKINNIPKAYFSFADLQKIVGTSPAGLRVAVSRAVKSGEIISLGKGIYARDIDDVSWENLAMNIYAPSYISLESALNYYNILSQQAAGITLITPKRGKEFNIHNHPLAYRHIRPDLFWGFKKVQDFLLAEPEKAFLDLAYLSLNGYGHFDPEEIDLALLDKQKIKKYLRTINSERLTKLISRLLFSL